MIVDGKQKKNIETAVALIKAGDIVGFPTETVYGLGGDVFSAQAISKIYQVKNRPFSDPLICHIASQEQLDLVAREVPPGARMLIERFWPGPLTLVLNKNKTIPDTLTAGLQTVAVRMPRHLIALALIKNSGKVIAAPSANLFQSLSPTTALDVEKELGDKVPLILDGGPCLVGVESTVLSFSSDEPLLLRPGGISQEDIEEVLGKSVTIGTQEKTNSGMSPGLLNFHYAPVKPLKYCDEKSLLSFTHKKRNLEILSRSVLICFSSDEEKKFKTKGFKEIFVLSKCGNLTEAAKNLFSFLRLADEGEYLKIFTLACPNERLGVALNDRLKKAEHGF